MQVVHALDLGCGVARVACDVLLNLDPSAYRRLACCLGHEGDMAAEVQRQGVEVFVFNAKSSTHPRHLARNLSVVLRLATLMRREGVQVVETHEFFSGTIGRAAAILAGVPAILQMVHNKDDWKRRPHILVDRLLAMRTDAIIANSDAVRAFALRQASLPPGKLITIHNGVDLSRFTDRPLAASPSPIDLPAGARVLTMVGRLTPQKGHVYLLEAIARLVGRFPELRLLLVGDDPEFDPPSKEKIRQKAQDLGLSDRVILLGWRPDIPAILKATEILVMPSLWEGFGLAIAEAMAAALPVVATRVDGIPEIVVDAETGILVPPRDPESLASAIATLLEDPHRAKAMGQAGKQRAIEHFSSRAMAAKVDALVRQTLSRKRVVASACA